MRQFDHNGLMLAEYQGKFYLNDQMNWIVQQRYLLKIFYPDLLSKIRFQYPSHHHDVREESRIFRTIGDTDCGKGNTLKVHCLDRVYA